MSALPIEKPLSPDEKDFTDYVGQGPAHKQPPTKRMKCSEEMDGDDDEKKEKSEEKQEKVQKESHAEPDPASVDIFANSQDGSNNGYETAPEQIEEEQEDEEDEEEIRKKKKVVVEDEEEDEEVADSQEQEQPQRDCDSDGSEELNNSYDEETNNWKPEQVGMLNADKTMVAEEDSSEIYGGGDAGGHIVDDSQNSSVDDDEVLRAVRLEQDTQADTPGKALAPPRKSMEHEEAADDDDQLEKTLQMSSPAAKQGNTSDDMELVSSSKSKSRESLGDTMDLFASPKADKSSRRSISPLATPKPESNAGKEELKEDDSEEQLQSSPNSPALDMKHLQLGSSLEKRLQLSGKKEKLMEESAEVKSPVQLPPVNTIFNQSGPLVPEMLTEKKVDETVEEKADEKKETVKDFLTDHTFPVADPNGSVHMYPYPKYLNLKFKQWFTGEKQRTFRPDFMKQTYDHTKNFIYCKIDGHNGVIPDSPRVPVDCPANTPENHRAFTTRGRLMRQPWHHYEASAFENIYYQQRKAVMENYLNMYDESGYQGFIGFLETMWGAGDEEIPMPALEQYFKDEYERIGEDAIYERFSDIVWWASQAEELVPKTVYRLVGNVESATFSQQQCAAILAWMMIMPEGKTFKNIFCGEDPVHVEKLKFLFNYFHVARSLPEGGTISFRRNRLCAIDDFDWTHPKDRKFEVKVMQNDMKIENAAFATQVDFANRSIGGGVLTRGFVQEEIRFMMCPEMMISLLLCDALKPVEAVSIVGAQVFSSYSGYGPSTKWQELAPNDARQNAPLTRDHYGRLRVETIAIDAQEYSQSSDLQALQTQMQWGAIRREFLKALSGFMTQGERFPLPIVTGWWGCGAFRGNKPLKVLIQACAAARAGRPLWICTFGDEETARLSKNMLEMFNQKNVTAGYVYQQLMMINGPCRFSESFVFDTLSTRINNRSVQTRYPQRHTQPSSTATASASTSSVTRPSTSEESPQKRTPFTPISPSSATARPSISNTVESPQSP